MRETSGKCAYGIENIPKLEIVIKNDTKGIYNFFSLDGFRFAYIIE